MLDEQKSQDNSKEDSALQAMDFSEETRSTSYQETDSAYLSYIREERNSRGARERAKGHSRLSGEGRGRSKSLLLVQIILCVVLLAAALLVKTADQSVYAQVQQSYLKLMEEKRFQWFSSANKKVEALMEEIMSALGGQQSQSQGISGVSYQPQQGGQGGWFGVSTQQKEDLQPPDGATFAPVTVTVSPVSPLKEMRITSSYGYRLHPISGALDFHTGIDLAASQGTNIRAAYPGKVKEVGESAIYGNYIILTHGNMETGYSHCESIVAKEGVVVRQGETIAKVGSTGVSTGPHLHFDVRVNGTLVDPLWLFLGLSYYHGEVTAEAA